MVLAMGITIAFLVGIVVGRGGVQQEAGENQSAETTEARGASTEEKTQGKTQTGERTRTSGRGSDSLTIGLYPGPVTFNYSYQDEGQVPGFSGVELLDGQGRYVAAIANDVGTTSGARTVNIPREGTYYVNVKADNGSWTLEAPPVAEP